MGIPDQAKPACSLEYSNTPRALLVIHGFNSASICGPIISRRDAALVIGVAAQVSTGAVPEAHTQNWSGTGSTLKCFIHSWCASQGRIPLKAVKLTNGSWIRLVGMIQGSSWRFKGLGKVSSPVVRTNSPLLAQVVEIRGQPS